MSNEVEVNPLSASGKWSDSPPPVEFAFTRVDDDLSLAEAQAELDRLLPGKRQPDLDDAIFDDPRYEAEVLWIKRTYHVGEPAVRAAIMKAFEGSGLDDVSIVMLYVSTSSTRDRAYLVMNSVQATEMLLDGTLSVVIRTALDKEDAKEGEVNSEKEELRDVTLWMDIADHLVPTEEQDPYTLYLWQLPTQLKAAHVEMELRKVIESLCPIYRLEVKENADGRCGSWAKVGFKYESHTRKCVYMLNYNHFMGAEIRAAFFQTNAASNRVDSRAPRGALRPRTATSNQKSRKNEKPRRPSDNKSPSINRKPASNRKGPAVKNTKPKKGTAPAKKVAEGADGWTVVNRK
jgi:hypothetical protein